MTAWVRSRASSLPRILLTWVLTVSLLTYSSSGDLAVGAASGDQSEHVDLASREVGDSLDIVARANAHELVDQPAGDVGGEQGVAGGHDADGIEQRFCRHILQEEAAGAGGQGVVDVLVEVERGEHDHAWRWVQLGRDRPRRIDAVEHRHANVHQDHVGPVGGGHGHRVRPVAGGADNRDVVAGVEKRCEAGAHDLLIVGDHHPDRCRHGAPTGRSATISNPPSGWPPTVSVPPIASTRSRIPTRPNPAASAAPS